MKCIGFRGVRGSVGPGVQSPATPILVHLGKKAPNLALLRPPTQHEV